MKKKEINLKRIFASCPLRVAVTDYCNLDCFFCSNEGMSLSYKNKKHIDIEKLKYLIEILAKNGLENITITGGEPSIYPHIENLLFFLKQFKFKNVFLHTNGVNLNRKLLNILSTVCNKIGVSLYSTEYHIWHTLTRGDKNQFERLIYNLKMLSELSDRILVELKYIPIRGYNDSLKNYKDFLEVCNKFGFKFKFLNFEPIIPSQIALNIPFKKIKRSLIAIGCESKGKGFEFRKQSNYLPIEKFKYKDTFGVAIEIGCGNPKVCKECYLCNEIFITPRLSIKPCHMNSYEISLEGFIKEKNEYLISKAILDSRVFLKQSPGSGLKVWQNCEQPNKRRRRN